MYANIEQGLKGEELGGELREFILDIAKKL